MLRLATSKKIKTNGITKENNSKERSNKEPFHQKLVMKRLDRGKKRLIDNGGNNKIKLRMIWLSNAERMLRGETLSNKEKEKMQESQVVLILNAMREIHE